MTFPVFIPTLEQLNALLNAPGARPATVPACVPYLDASRFMSETRNAALAYVGGAALFEHVYRGSYEGHIFVQPGHRGRAAIAFGKTAIGWLFKTVGADRLIVAAPKQLPAVRVYCNRLGMESLGKDLFFEHFQTEAVQWAA